MLLMDLVAALVIGLFLALLFSAIFQERVPWGSFWVFLLFVFLGTWAGGI